jgi:hypothetical protein
MALSLKNFLLVLLASFTTAQYAQLSSSKNQVLGALGKGTVLTYDNIDALSGLKFTSGTGVIEIPPGGNGTYFVIAAPQVGCNGCGGFLSRSGFTADFWVAQNGVAVANSNVRLVGSKSTKDVIVTQGLVPAAVSNLYVSDRAKNGDMSLNPFVHFRLLSLYSRRLATKSRFSVAEQKRCAKPLPKLANH